MGDKGERAMGDKERGRSLWRGRWVIKGRGRWVIKGEGEACEEGDG